MRSTILAAAALMIGACTSANGEGTPGPVGARSFEPGAFHAVRSDGAYDVTVQVGGAPSVRAEGDAEALERLDVRVEDGVLRIGTRREGWMSGWNHRGRVTVHVTAPSLDAASIAGSGDMSIDRVRAQAFEGSVAGSGDMEIGALQAERASFSIAGSGNIRAAGSAGATDVAIAGSGDVGLESLQSRNASVSIAGSGNIRIRASEGVTGSIMGSGDVVVSGGARCSVSKMGSGDIRCG